MRRGAKEGGGDAEEEIRGLGVLAAVGAGQLGHISLKVQPCSANSLC